jgi:allantoin racemase
MRFLFVNPNGTASMTAKIRAAACAVAADPLCVDATQPEGAPESIEGYVDEAFSVPGVLREIKRGNTAGYGGFAIACFDDSGLDAARSIADAPVVGIGEAAYHLASLVAGRFSVITTLPRSVPALEHNLIRYGLSARCAAVRAADVPVLALEDPKSDARKLISNEIAKSLSMDRAEAIVLGCAGMADLARELSDAHQVPVIEGVSAAMKLLEALSSLGLRTAKAGAWAPPLPKPYLAAALNGHLIGA